LRITGVCLPFVVGAFYVTAIPEADRQLSRDQIQNLLRVFRPIAGSLPNIQVEAVSASPDAAGYAQQFMGVFHIAGMRVNGIAPDDNSSTLFPASAQVSSSRMHGVYIGVSGGSVPPRASQFQASLLTAGFEAPIIRWNGVGADDFIFVVSYR
jgi:hypothetical protein